MLRTGYSTIIKESQDFTFAIFDAHGRMVAQGVPQPLHIGPLSAQVNEIRRVFAGRIEPGDAYHRQPSLPGLPEPRDRRHHHLAGVLRRQARRLHRQHRPQARPRRQGAGHQQRRRHRPVSGGPADPAAEDPAPRRHQRRPAGDDLRQHAHAGGHLGRRQGADQHQHLRPRQMRRAVRQARRRQGAGMLAALDGHLRDRAAPGDRQGARTACTARSTTGSTTTASISASPIASRRRWRRRATPSTSCSTATPRRAGRSTCAPACRAISSSAASR